MPINYFLIAMVTLLGAFVLKGNRPLVAVIVCCYWGLSTFQDSLNDTNFYYSAVIADLIVFLSALSLRNSFYLRVSIISVGFIFLHAIGYYLTFAYLPIYPYDYGLTVLYCYLVYTILTKGGSAHVLGDMLREFRNTGSIAYRLHHWAGYSMCHETKIENSREKKC